MLQRDLSIELLGTRHPSPLLLGPIGVLGIVHEQAEVAVAQAGSAGVRAASSCV